MRFELQQKASCFDILNPYAVELCKQFRYRNQKELGDQSSAAKFLGSAAFTLGAGALDLVQLYKHPLQRQTTAF